jgi:hypothetical protein
LPNGFKKRIDINPQLKGRLTAAEPEPRIQPYSKGFPAISGFAALTDNASAIEVVGASAAA